MAVSAQSSQATQATHNFYFGGLIMSKEIFNLIWKQIYMGEVITNKIVFTFADVSWLVEMNGYDNDGLHKVWVKRMHLKDSVYEENEALIKWYF